MKLSKGFDFSQSNLQDYLDCPYRFYLRHIRCVKWPALVVNEAVEFERRGLAGGRFHRLVQQYLMGIPAERISEFITADPNPDLSLWWDNFIAAIPPALSGERWIETILSMPFGEHRLLAKYDLILVQNENQISIFDWKTSHTLPRKDWLLDKVQTKVYRFLLAQAGQTLVETRRLDPGKITMNYWFALHPENPISLPYSQTAFEADQKNLSHLIWEIIETPEESFYKTHNRKHCRYCVFRSHCDRGTHAGDLAHMEDFQVEWDENQPNLNFEQIGEIKF